MAKSKLPKLASIVFFGTPSFAATILDHLVKNNFPVTLVVTAPDKPQGRKKIVVSSAVKQYAQEKKIPVLQPTRLKDDAFVSTLKKTAPQLMVVVAFRMLPKVVWSIPTYGTINLHASLLPNYRGAAPINWAIINGETITGLTTFLINESIDTGDILKQKTVAITNSDNANSLINKMTPIGADLTVQTILDLINDKIKATKQDSTGNEHLAPKLTTKNTEIDWQKSLTEIHNQIRGLATKPGAWSTMRLNDKPIKFKIFATSPIYENHSLNNKTLILNNGHLLISCKNGFLRVTSIQLEGKKMMTATDFINGYSSYFTKVKAEKSIIIL